MKHVKKLASLLLALIMVFALATTAGAANGRNDNTGKITIDNAVNGKKYTIHEILELESYDTDKKAYSYKVTEDWAPFLELETIKDIYLKADKQGYVTWVDEASVTDFVKLATEYADELLKNEGQKTAADGKVEFTNLNLGYYLVVSDLGALCALDTTTPNVTMKEKNAEPTITKQVKEGETWGTTSSAKIGDKVDYQVTIKAIDGEPENYVMHDVMSEGLTFNNDVAVEINGVLAVEVTNYTVTTDTTDGCTFEVSFTGLKPNDVIVVTYSATVNENAVMKGETTNTNKAKLTYKDNTNGEWSQVSTDSFQFDLVKTDATNVLLTGAKFELYTAKTDGTNIALVKEQDGTYRVATADEYTAEGFESAVIEAGKVTVKGLDANTNYWLEETVAPAGYNKLKDRVQVAMASEHLTATMEDNTWVSGGVHVINYTGAELPSTGGMGTTLFYVLGSALVLGAVVLLITKKRMAANG